MTLPRLLKTAALVLAVHGMGRTSGFAENAPVSPPPGYLAASANKPAAAPEDPGPRMDFKFNGVPLIEALRFIQDRYHQAAAPKSLNLVIGEHLRELAETNVVTLDVKQVTAVEVLALIGKASQANLFRPANPNFPYKEGFSFAPAPVSGGNPTYLLQSDYPSGYSDYRASMVVNQPPPPVERKTVSYFSLEPLLERYKVEDITTAMKLGWELSGITNLPTMKFHEETKLLVVSATDEQMLVVNQVIQNLTATAKARALEGRLQKAALPGAGTPAPATQSAVPVSPAKP